MTFDYTGFEPMDKHGSRWVNRKRRDRYGLRMQVAGPWRPEGCEERSTASFAWMKVLVYRRDLGTCQSCGLTVAHGDGESEVQHILPRSALWQRQFPGEKPYYLLHKLAGKSTVPSTISETQEHYGRGARRVPRSSYVNVGSCGHNLVLLCRRCHVMTFRSGYGGVPTLYVRRLDDFRSGQIP